MSSAELPCVTRPLVWLAIHLVLVHILTAVECVEEAIAPATFPLAGSSTLAAVHLWVHVKENALQKGDKERTNILLHKNTDYKAWAEKCLPQTFNCLVNCWLSSSASLHMWFPRLQGNMSPSFSRDQGFLHGPWILDQHSTNQSSSDAVSYHSAPETLTAPLWKPVNLPIIYGYRSHMSST